MATVRSIDEVLKNAKEEASKRSALFLSRMINGETIDKEEKKELKDIKSEIKFIEKMIEETTGKKVNAVSSEYITKDLVAKVKALNTTIGDIVRTTKNQT